MSFNVVPFGSTSGRDSRPVAEPAEASPAPAGPAEVVELASRRPAERDPRDIPDHVWDEVDAATRLWHELHGSDRQVRFETDPLTGRVVASLCDVDGGVVRPLPLRDVVRIDDPGPQSAA